MSDKAMTGTLRKMRVSLAEPVDYGIPVGERVFPVSPRIGDTIALTHTGRILCIECGRETKKSFAQGYCFPCFKSLAECDMCIMKPETCHFNAGTCRDEAWAHRPARAGTQRSITRLDHFLAMDTAGRDEHP